MHPITTGVLIGLNNVFFFGYGFWLGLQVKINKCYDSGKNKDPLN